MFVLYVRPRPTRDLNLTFSSRFVTAVPYKPGMATLHVSPAQINSRHIALEHLIPALGVLGFVALLTLELVGFIGLGTLNMALAAALLIVVPSVLSLADAPAEHAIYLELRRLLLTAHPASAALAVIALTLLPGLTATALGALWLLYALGIAAAGALRFASRADRLAPAELCIDAGLVQTAVAGFAFLTACAGLPFLGYEYPWQTLTAVHFSYAGMALPVFAGMIGRALNGRCARAFGLVAPGVIFGSALVGFGILWSPLLEVLSVIALSASLWVCAGLVLGVVAPAIKRWPLKLGLMLSAAVLFVSMPLAVLYALGDVRGELILTIPQMIDTHGRLNAFGFGLLGALCWLALRPAAPPVQHPDARTLDARRGEPLTFTAGAKEAGMTVHAFERVLGYDPTGALFARAGKAILHYRFYPEHVISSVSDFGLQGRAARPGDRIVLRLHLLHALGVSWLYARALVEVNAVVDTPVCKSISYVTTRWHLARGGCRATLFWRKDGDGAVIMRVRSVEEPVWCVLKLPFVTPVFRGLLDRALKSGLEKMERG